MTPNQGDNQDQPGGQRRGQPQGQPPQRRPQSGGQRQPGSQQSGLGRGQPGTGGRQGPGGQAQQGGQPRHGGQPQHGGQAQHGQPRQGGQPGGGTPGGGMPGQPGQSGQPGMAPGVSQQQTGPTPGQQGLGQPPSAQPQPVPGQPGMAGMGGQPSPPMGGGPQPMGGPTPGRGMGRPGMRPQLQSVTIEDIVQTDVVTAETDTPIATVVAEMAEQDVGSVIVVEDDEPTGILTDRTICLALEEDPQVTERTAGDLTSGDLTTATTDDSVFDAIQQLGDANVRRLPIVDDDGRLEGIVSLDDILVLLGAELHNAVDVIKDQSPRI